MTLWIDPLSKKIIIEPPDCAMKVNDLGSVKELGMMLLEAAEKLEQRLLDVSESLSNEKLISSGYEARAIRDWEEYVAGRPINTQDPEE